MAVLTKIVMPGTQDYTGAIISSGQTTLSSGGGDTWAASGRDMVLLEHSGGTPTRSVTFTSQPDALGRLTNMVVSIAQNTRHIAGPFALEGWADSSGDITVAVDAGTDVQIVVLEVPPSITG